MRRSTGFTLVELVMVISIVGIIAVFAMSRIGGGYANTVRYYQELMAQITYARKTAIAQRRSVCVHMASGQSEVHYASGGTCPGSAPVISPTGATGFLITAKTGTSSDTAAAILFDATGRYAYKDPPGSAPTTALTVTVSGEGSYSLTIERETGYVHP